MYRVYALLDPATSIPYYVGQTGQTLKSRLSWFPFGYNDAVHDWADTLPTKPQIVELATAPTRPEIVALEADWIARYRALGYPLLNIRLDDRVGWPGFQGHRHTDRVRSICRETGRRNKGRKRPDLAERNAAKVWDDRSRDTTSMTTRAAMHRPDVRAKMEAYWDRRWPNRTKS